MLYEFSLDFMKKKKTREAEEFQLDHAFQRVGLTVACRHVCVCIRIPEHS